MCVCLLTIENTLESLINQSLSDHVSLCTVNGVELFFNIPAHHRLPSTLFTYHVISVSAQYHVVPDATQTVQQVQCSADLLGQLRLFLNKGWKLVDICIDSTAIADGRLPYLICSINRKNIEEIGMQCCGRLCWLQTK